MESESLAKACARLAENIKGEDIVVLHVAPLTTLADYFVIASARNVRQIRAMAREIEMGARKLGGGRRLGVEGTAESGWVLLDLGDVIVHVFERATRSVYDLEMLWGDAQTVDWREDGAQ